MKSLNTYLLSSLLLSIGILSFEIEFKADKTEIDTKNNLLVLDGNVSVSYENWLLNAEEAKINNNKKSLVLESFKFSSIDNYVYGKSSKGRINEDEFIFEDVEFSTCPCEERIWWVESDKIIYKSSDKYISTKNSKLVVNGKPIAYLKEGNFPISTQRKTGILLPEISVNERSGIDAKLPVYINLRENFDLTLEPRIMTQRGFGLANEFRYLGDNYEGFFNASFLKDDKPNYNLLEENSFRWSYNFFHKSELSKNTFLEINSSSTGDPFFFTDLGGFLSGLSRTYYLPQKVNLDFFSKQFRGSFNLNTFKITNPLSENKFQRIPGIELFWYKKILDLEFSIYSDIGFFKKGGSFRKQNEESLTRIILIPEFSYSHSKGNYLLDANLKLKYKNYNSRYYKDSEFLPLLTIQNKLNYFGNLSKGRFTFSPFFDLSFSDNKTFQNKINLDSGIRLETHNSNTFFGKDILDSQQEVLVGTTLNFRMGEKRNLKAKISKLIAFQDKNFFYNNVSYNLPEPFQLKLRYSEGERITYKSEVSIEKKDGFNFFLNSLNFKDKDMKYSFSHYKVKNLNLYKIGANQNLKKEINSLEFSALGRIKGNWNGGIKVNYDLNNSKKVNNVLNLEYENKGLILGFSYIKTKELDWIRILENNTFYDFNRDRFRINFELKGLGSLGRNKEEYFGRRKL